MSSISKKLSRGQKAIIATGTSFILELVNVVSAFIIPRLILSSYGSDVNGLISSITQFLAYANLLQMGVGGVVRANLYKPLAQHDNEQISRIMRATELFFYKIAFVCVGYICILSIVFPFKFKYEFSFIYIASLVLIIGLGTAAQYFWGFPYRSLVMADQRVYIFDFLQILCTIANIVLSAVFIVAGFSIHFVKFMASFVFCIQPIVLKVYCYRHYKLNKQAQADPNAIKQRWSGAGYSLADFVHRNTDVFVLTLFASLKLVSVYYVYSIIFNGINSLITMGTNSFGSAIGDMIAKKEEKILNDTFSVYVFITHLISSIVYSVAFMMIIPFIKLYTINVTDENYIRPIFAVVILLAELLFCLRQPYQTVITSAGHFKQTQRGAFIEAGLNILISVFFVINYGLIGVAIGTLIAMIFRTIDLILYLKRNLIQFSFSSVIKRYFVSSIPIILSIVFSFIIELEINNYFYWFLYAAIITIIISFISLCLNLLFFKKEFTITVKKFRSIIPLKK